MIDNEKKSILYFIYLSNCKDNKNIKHFDEVSIEDLKILIAELKQVKEGGIEWENNLFLQSCFYRQA